MRLSIAEKSADMRTWSGDAQTVARAMSPMTDKWIAVGEQTVAVASADGVNSVERQAGLVILQVLELRPASAPAAGRAAVEAAGSA